MVLLGLVHYLFGLIFPGESKYYYWSFYGGSHLVRAELGFRRWPSSGGSGAVVWWCDRQVDGTIWLALASSRETVGVSSGWGDTPRQVRRRWLGERVVFVG